MPHLDIQLSGQPDDALARRAVDVLNALTEQVLGKDPAVMATTVHWHADEDWFIGGRSLSELGASAFNLTISITDETNTKAQKACFLQEVHAAMTALRADTHAVSYVHLVDARAAAYGYGGRTQEWRHQHAAP